MSGSGEAVAKPARRRRRTELESLARPEGRLDPAFRLSRADERRLLAAARRGDARALGRLLTMLSGPVYRFGRGFCGDPDDAEDVTQITLAALARSLRSFRGDASLTTWAYTVARNACTRHRRRPAHAPARFEPIGPGTDERPGALDVADPGEDPEGALERSETRRAIERAIAGLPASQREVLVLRDVEGLSAKEVGEQLGLSERAVKSRLHRARVTLREVLAPRAGPRAGCPDTARLISRYLEGELDADTCARLEQHVNQCPHCGAACDALKSVLRTCRSMRGARAPAEVRASIRRALRQLVVEPRSS